MSRRLLPLLLFFTTLSAFGDDAALFTLYKTRVAPIIQGTCIGCHVSGGRASSTSLVYASGSSTSVRRQTSAWCGLTLKVISTRVRSTRF